MEPHSRIMLLEIELFRIMVVYSSYTTYINICACANGAELAIFEIIFPSKARLETGHIEFCGRYRRWTMADTFGI